MPAAAGGEVGLPDVVERRNMRAVLVVEDVKGVFVSDGCVEVVVEQSRFGERGAVSSSFVTKAGVCDVQVEGLDKDVMVELFDAVAGGVSVDFLIPVAGLVYLAPQANQLNSSFTEEGEYAPVAGDDNVARPGHDGEPVEATAVNIDEEVAVEGVVVNDVELVIDGVRGVAAASVLVGGGGSVLGCSYSVGEHDVSGDGFDGRGDVVVGGERRDAASGVVDETSVGGGARAGGGPPLAVDGKPCRRRPHGVGMSGTGCRESSVRRPRNRPPRRCDFG